MYIDDKIYVSKFEKVDQTENKKTEVCWYELHDGSYLVVEQKYESRDADWGKDWKMTACKSYSTMDKPDDLDKETQLKRLIEVAKNIKV